MREYTHYLFDADGTLTDTTELIYRCFQHTCRKYGGFEIDRDTVIAHIGLPLRNQLEVYLGSLAGDRADEIRRSHMEYQLSIYQDHLRLFPGIYEMLDELSGRGAHCAVVTSRMMHTTELYLRHTGIFDYFSAVVTPESTREHKPHAAPALKALEIMGGAASSNALFIGDATYDIECGSAAGMDTAFVSWSHNAIDSLKVTPTYILREPRDLAIRSVNDRQGDGVTALDS